jgi:hypothetical protein
MPIVVVRRIDNGKHQAILFAIIKQSHVTLIAGVLDSLRAEQHGL